MPYADCSFAEISHAVVHKVSISIRSKVDLEYVMPSHSLSHSLSVYLGQNLRPEIPKCCPQSVANIMKRCWDPNPDKRPEMDEVVKMLEAVDTSKGGGMIAPDQFQGCLCFFRPRGP